MRVSGNGRALADVFHGGTTCGKRYTHKGATGQIHQPLASKAKGKAHFTGM